MVSTNTGNSSNMTTQDITEKQTNKEYQLKMFILKRKFRKISVDLREHFELAAEPHQAEGRWLDEQLNSVKLRIFRVGTRRPTVSRREGQHLTQLKTFLKDKASE
jgi:phenylalanyl-tRNA synthetase alpha subunit